MAGGCQDEALKAGLESLPPYIDYLGQIPQAALADVLRSSDIFILPSYFEGLPLVLIEAMASGAVPVSTDLPGVREWIDSNVASPNVRYVPVPEMAGIDEPTQKGRADFTDDLVSSIGRAIADISSGSASSALPDTSSITWDSVAGRILNFSL
jgi:glycosyltransferase involved in cell wall biosynthesis